MASDSYVAAQKRLAIELALFDDGLEWDECDHDSQCIYLEIADGMMLKCGLVPATADHFWTWKPTLGSVGDGAFYCRDCRAEKPSNVGCTGVLQTSEKKPYVAPAIIAEMELPR